LDSRSSYRSSSGLSSGGLPLGRFMGRSMPVQVFLDKWCGWAFNVRTLNRRLK
jgi:hypothetical protein